MRIAIGQINPTLGDFEANVKKISSFINKALKERADIITFPELSLSGYPPEDLLFKESFVSKSLKAIDEVAKSAGDIVVVLGSPYSDKNNKIRNSAVIARNGKIMDIYNKIELPNYGVFDEKRYFEQGCEIRVYRIGDLILGINICEDIWLDNVTEEQVKMGADFILNISASPYHTGKREIRYNLIKTKAKRLNVHIAYTNLVGGQDELIFDGGSFVVDNHGKIIASARDFEEDLLITDLDIKPKGLKIYGVTLLGNCKKHKTIKRARRAGELKEIEEINKALTLGTRDFILKNGFKRVVIGLSGGIDSGLTAAIACNAIGNKNVVGISMPSRFSSKATRDDARRLAKNLKIKFYEFPIDKIFESYLKEFQNVLGKSKSGVAEENIQARIRGNILMGLSNKYGWLVLTTGNKSEVSCGYCTLYGDTAGGFAVIKDLYKTNVYKLSNYLNRKNEIIPKSIIKRPPTAELRENQRDQDSLPPYDILDKILKAYIERRENFKKIANNNRLAEELVLSVIKMVDRSEYKRRQSPPGIKITPTAFGKDRRMPITNKICD